MELLTELEWNSRLSDPFGRRPSKPRTTGLTMVIDKGIGLQAFRDLLQISGPYIDIIKLGFGTSALYPREVLQQKIKLCRDRQITIMPGGTFLEVAVLQDAIEHFYAMVQSLGFTGIEISDGTIDMSRELRTKLIRQGKDLNIRVFTEYGKKIWGSSIEIEELLLTTACDLQDGAEFVTVEGRESGVGVGIYDDKGNCKQDDIDQVLSRLENPHVLLWEAPQKSQQVQLIHQLGPDVNLGNILPEEILSLEALRRGLRSDTMSGMENRSLYR